jgi:hypothetical protein
MENINFILNEKTEKSDTLSINNGECEGELNALYETIIPDTNFTYTIITPSIDQVKLFYKMNYSVKKLNQVLTYYGIQKSTRKMTKDEMIQVLLFYESDPDNRERVQHRIRLWRMWEELKNDSYFSKYILDI